MSLWGAPIAFIAIGLSFGLAAIVISRTPDPPAQKAATRSLLAVAWQGLVYTWRNPTLRALGLSCSVLNLSGGTFTIVVPLIVLERLHFSQTVVGLVIAVQGVAGMVAAIVFGRMDSRNRERGMLAIPMFGMGIAISILLLKSDLVALILVMGITGLLNGPLDIALFTLRQRRTDPGWSGRAFAVSMSFNYLGVPIGAAVAGIVAAHSIDEALAFGVVMSVAAGIIAIRMIPSSKGGIE